MVSQMVSQNIKVNFKFLNQILLQSSKCLKIVTSFRNIKHRAQSIEIHFQDK